MLIQDLPDFPAIQRIRDALYGRGDVYGAAVMVGAGFSRFATLSDMSSTPPPLWSDFSNRMKNQLYPNQCVSRDPLRLAQEYKAELGEPALDGLIRSMIQDEKWEPSCLHEMLLSLPWSDVLTTNWDTLLERTQLLETERTYDIIRTIDDISWTKAPRIVKLHGSLPANKPFIITEEDYRTYRKKFAPFVNLAQQVLLENELCLIGFSGDDPNFIQWAGWVRDNLGSASRQIRLIGVLDLSRSNKEMLRQYNVTPIDLSPLVIHLEKDVRHQEATLLFLKWLNNVKSVDSCVWDMPSEDCSQDPSSPNAAAKTFQEISSAWRQDRLKHPGWLVTPEDLQQRIRHKTNSYHATLQKLTELTDIQDKMHFLFELAWRYEIAFWPMDEQYAKIIRETFSSGGEKHLLLHEKTRLCAFLYAEARRQWDWDSFEFWADQLKKINNPQASVERIYGKALRAKQEFDYVSLKELAPKIAGQDPVWKIRQGMLYTFLFEDKKAAMCFRIARNEIRALRARDRNSIWLLSREAWVVLVHRFARMEFTEDEGKYKTKFSEWPTHYSKRKCDPWDYLNFVDQRIAQEFEKNLSKKATITLLFNPGYFRRNSAWIPIGNGANVFAIDQLIRVQEVAGIPSRIGRIDLLSTRLERAFELKPHNTKWSHLIAASFLNSPEKGLMASIFNRIKIARIPQEAVVNLAAVLKEATDYLLGKSNGVNRSRCINQICKNIELISRLSVRMSAEEARTCYQWALALCSDDNVNHWTLYEHVHNVLKRCLEAMPKGEKGKLAETAIFLPLPGERNATGRIAGWPELIDEFELKDIRRPENNLNWTLRISELISAIHSEVKHDRDRAIRRLHVLYKAGCLSDDEGQELANAIWSQINTEDGWPSTFSVDPFVFLELPETEPGRAKELFFSSCIGRIRNGIIEPKLLRNATCGLNSSIDILQDARQHFGDILCACLNWVPKSSPIALNRFGIESENDATREEIVRLLAGTLLPKMSKTHVADRVKRVWNIKLTDANDQFWVATAYEYSRIFPETIEEMIRIVRKSIYCQNANKIAFGYYAVQGFIEGSKRGKGKIPNILVSDVISTCERMRDLGLHDSLNTAIKLVVSGLLCNDDLQRLAESVEPIWSEFSYESEVAGDERMIALTLIRSECAKLANALKMSGLESEAVDIVCSEAAVDPIPEVRYSV